MSQETVQQYWAKVDKHLRILQFVPGLRMVAVCNNLAFGKVSDDSDIDLFVVAKKGRLFSVRSFLTFLLHLKGVRRHADKVAGRFCLSFFVDDSALNLSSIALEDDVYLAYWIKGMLPVIDDGVSGEISESNRWVEDFFETKVLEISRRKVLPVSKLAIVLKFLYKWTFDLIFGGLIEFVLKKWQMKRAGLKADKADDGASLIVSEHILKFHNIDRRKMYRDKWRQNFGLSKLSDEKFLLL